MESYIVPMLIGIICIVLGVCNTKGQLGSIHWYHRKNVTEENRIPFGKAIGRGTIIIGVSLVIYGGLSLATRLSKNNLFVLIGAIVLTVGIVVGLVLSFYAMFKYNKGIF